MKSNKYTDFLRCKDNRLDEKANAIPKKTLSKNGYPDWISLLKVCPWLSKDLSRTWYRCNTFYVKSIPEWQAFVTQATWENVYRIRQLRIDNEFMFCLRDNIGKDSDWRSYNLISHLKNLKLLTLYRDDGGPGTYTSGGYEEFDSVEWFVKLATDCKSLQHIRFALYPWSGFAGYSLAKSNMVAWIKDWEHEWNAVMAVRRVKGSKNPQSWYLDISPTAKSQRRQARRGYGVSSLLFDDNNS